MISVTAVTHPACCCQSCNNSCLDMRRQNLRVRLWFVLNASYCSKTRCKRTTAYVCAPVALIKFCSECNIYAYLVYIFILLLCHVNCFGFLHRRTPECRIRQGCTVLILHNCRNCKNFILSHLFQVAYIDRAARMEVAKIEVRCDYCQTWRDKEENLQVILDTTRSWLATHT